MRQAIAGSVLLAAAMVAGPGEAMPGPGSLPLVALSQDGRIIRVQSAQAAQTEPKASPSIGALLANADPAAGEAYAKRVCAACHSLNEGGKAIVGPNLYGVVGGPHAHMQGFNYSDALRSKQGPWTYDELNAWLTKPSSYAPGTRMAFPGIKDDKLRLDVIAFLRTLSSNPEPLPAPQAAQETPARSDQ
jgi:cytochrome c